MMRVQLTGSCLSMSYTASLALDGGLSLDKFCNKILGEESGDMRADHDALGVLYKSQPQLEIQVDDTVTSESAAGNRRGPIVKNIKILPAREGEALIHKLELLKDTRFSQWRHEFIVLTLSYAGKNRLLYLEHSWDADTRLGELMPFLNLTSSNLFGSQKTSADETMFYRANDSEEHDRRRYTMTVFEIQFSDHDQAVTLHTIAKILRQIGRQHPAYALFSANCWAWSRGIVMALVLESRNIQTVTMSGKDVTLDQLKFYLMTEYGAFGGLLLRCIGTCRISQRVSPPNSLESQRKGGET